MYVIMILLLVLIMLFLYLYLHNRYELTLLLKQIRYHREEQSTFDAFSISGNRQIKEICKEMDMLRDSLQKDMKQHLQHERNTEEMITNISHDIRTPLTSIQGYLEMLHQSNDPKEKERYHQIITNRLHELEGLLDEFFLYTKLRNSNDQMVVEEMEVYPIVCSVLLNYMEELQAHQLEPIIQCTCESLTANIHEESCRRLCINLTMNAIRYGKPPLHISLCTHEDGIDLCFENDVDDVETLQVTSLFDRFYKGDTSRNQKGSGLGLAIVKELAEHMGGYVYARTNHNKLQIHVILK